MIEDEATLALDVPATFDDATRAGEAVEEFLGRMRVPRRTAHAIVMAVEELLTNTIKYGFDSGCASECIRVRVAADQAEVRLRITDRGRQFDPLRWPKPDLDAAIEERDVGGLGLHLIRTLSTRQEYRRTDGSNVVTLSFARAAQGAE